VGRLPWDRFFALGQASGGTSEFNMTYLAMNFAGYVNGVSKLHGLASQKLLHAFWPGLLRERGAGGVDHQRRAPATWTQSGIVRLLRGDDDTGRAGADFAQRRRASTRRAALARAPGQQGDPRRHVRQTLTNAFHARGDSPVVLSAMLAGLDPNALYLGFARRFAPYKRAHLLFSDPARCCASCPTPSGRCASSCPARRTRATSSARTS
jgi:glucan phosphorylase